MPIATKQIDHYDTPSLHLQGRRCNPPHAVSAFFLQAGHTRPLRRPLHPLSGKAETSDFFDRKCRTFASKVPMFSFSGTAPFRPAVHALQPRKPWKREETGGETGAEKIFYSPCRKTKTKGGGAKTCAFYLFFLGISQKDPNFTHKIFRCPAGTSAASPPCSIAACLQRRPEEPEHIPSQPKRKLWKQSPTSTKRHPSCLPSTGPLPG